MASADTAQLIVSLSLVDNMSAGLMKTSEALVQTSLAATKSAEQIQQSFGSLTVSDKLALGLQRVDDEIGNTGDSVRVKVAEINDSLGTLGDNIGAGLSKAGTAVSNFGTTLETNRTKIREFGRAGSELAIVAAVLGPQLDGALKPLGEFIHIAGDAGLVATAFSDIGPAAARGIAGFIGLGASAAAATPEIAGAGTAAAAATPEIAGLGAAADLAAVPIGIVGGVLSTLGLPLIVAAAGVVAFVSAAQRVVTPAEQLATQAQVTSERIDLLNRQFEAGQITASRYADEMAQIIPPTRDADKQIVVLSASMHDLDGALGLVEDGLISVDPHLKNFIANAEAAGSRNVEENVAALGDAFDAMNRPITAAEQAALDLAKALNDIPRNIDINFQFGGLGSGANPAIKNPNAPPGSADANRGTAGGVTGDQAALDAANQAANTQAALNKARADAAAAAAKTAADKAASDAKSRQSALNAAAASAAAAERQHQAEIAAAITDRYRTAKQLEDDYFAKVHQNNLKAIQDEHDKAQAAHDRAIAGINDALQTQLALNAQPVNAAQLALQNTQNQQTLRNLTESADAAFTAAQANPADAGLQRALRDAREALGNFKAQLNIQDLQNKQAAADADAKHKAAVATAAADATLATADQKAKHDTIVENGRYATLQKNFNNAMDKILKDTVAKHASLNTALQRLVDLINRYAGKPLPTKDTQTGKQTQSVHVTVNVPPITIGARAITNAMTTQINPAQSPFVRSGQVTPKISPG